MSKRILPQQNKNIHRPLQTPLRDNPALKEFAIDTVRFTRKWQSPQIAQAMGISTPGLNKAVIRDTEKLYDSAYLYNSLFIVESDIQELIDWSINNNDLCLDELHSFQNSFHDLRRLMQKEEK